MSGPIKKGCRSGKGCSSGKGCRSVKGMSWLSNPAMKTAFGPAKVGDSRPTQSKWREREARALEETTANQFLATRVPITSPDMKECINELKASVSSPVDTCDEEEEAAHFRKVANSFELEVGNQAGACSQQLHFGGGSSRKKRKTKRRSKKRSKKRSRRRIQ